MDTPGLTLPPDYDAYRARAQGYIARASRFPFQWGMPNGLKTRDGTPTEFFRFDQRRLKRMVERGEHIIRCLIIWMALIRLRAGLVVPVASKLPVATSDNLHTRDEHPQDHPDQHLFSLRALPLYDAKLPSFSISLPSPEDRATASEEGRRAHRTGRKAQRRPRNDTIQSATFLVARIGRLYDLFGQIDDRAERIAAHWAGRLQPEIKAYQAELTRRIEVANTHDASPDLSGLTRPELRPLKTGFPPDDLSDDAPDDERDDLLALHDVALRAADRFHELCG